MNEKVEKDYLFCKEHSKLKSACCECKDKEISRLTARVERLEGVAKAANRLDFAENSEGEAVTTIELANELQSALAVLEADEAKATGRE